MNSIKQFLILFAIVAFVAAKSDLDGNRSQSGGASSGGGSSDGGSSDRSSSKGGSSNGGSSDGGSSDRSSSNGGSSNGGSSDGGSSDGGSSDGGRSGGGSSDGGFSDGGSSNEGSSNEGSSNGGSSNGGSSDGGRSGGGHSGGGNSGEDRGCFIAPAGTTNCTGLTGDSCKNVTSLTALAKAGVTTVLVCQARSSTPTNAPLTLRLAVEIKGSCFTVPAEETRTCAVLNADPTFVKISCNNQTNLLSLLIVASTARSCTIGRFGRVRDVTVPIIATIRRS